MSAPSTPVLLRRHAVPLAVFVIVMGAVLVVPPVVLGELTARTYALTAAIVILAVGAGLPYAVVVVLGTLPLLYTGTASFAAPQTAADGPHSFSAVAALRHGAAGLAYVLGAAVVGSVGMGAQIAVGSDATAVPAVLQPSFLYLGGGSVAGAFVCLQLWRYDTPVGGLALRTVLGTVILGMLLAVSPAVAYWVFGGAGF